MRKQFCRRTAAFSMALLLTAGSTMASASEALGWDVHTGKIPLSQNTQLEKNIFWSDTFSDLRTEHFVSFTPGGAVRPRVTAGSSVMSRATLTEMAKQLQSQGERLVSAVNGDYFVMNTGAPVGLVVSGGKLLATPTYSDGLALGFYEDGSTVIGVPGIRATAELPSGSVEIRGGVNKVRQMQVGGKAGGLTLLTPDFAPNTQNTEPGVDVVLIPGEGAAALTIGESRVCSVEKVVESTGSMKLPEGRFVLTLNAKDNAELLAKLRALVPGDQVTIRVEAQDERFNSIQEGIGSLCRILENGKIQPGLDQERTARSAIGIRADGTVVFYTIDGKRPGYSVGATLKQVGQRLMELGCVDAVCLDGGGSTTLGAVYPGNSDFSLVNKPSGGAQRHISTAVFLTTSLEATGVRGSYYVTPNDSMLLSGASVQLQAHALDTGYVPMESGDVSWSVSGGGSVSENGIFTAGTEKGQTQVIADDGTASGTGWITTVQTPGEIRLVRESDGKRVTELNLDPETVIDLNAEAYYRTLKLGADDRCFIWSADPAVGTVSGDGVLTTGKERGSGKLTVRAGERTLTIPVRVAGHVEARENFESAEHSFSSSDTVKAEVEKNTDHVRYGRQSLKAVYRAPDGTAELQASLPIPAGEHYLGLWVRSDDSGNLLLANIRDSKGNTEQIALGTLIGNGWQQMRIALPEDARQLTGLELICTGVHREGTIWLDQITSATEDTVDLTPPSVTAEVRDGRLQFRVSDDLDQEIPSSGITVTCDGKSMKFSWDAGKGSGKLTLPELDDSGHRISVIAADASGNLARASVDVEAKEPVAVPAEPEASAAPEETPEQEHPSETEMPDQPAPAVSPRPVFGDMEGHWAGKYGNYLFARDISNGVIGEDGIRRFQPDRRITRAEFFVMTARWMGLDLSRYDQVELPFADTDQIPPWALREVKAMYSLGILKGSPSENGALRVNTAAEISRAEVMTVLGRTQPRGYAEAQLDFTDADRTPVWAASYVRTLVGQKVVGGFDGKLNPMGLITRGEVAKMLYTMW